MVAGGRLRRRTPGNLAHLALVAAACVVAPITAADAASAAPPTPVCAIQGSGQASPLVGQEVTTSGIVTAVGSDGGIEPHRQSCSFMIVGWIFPSRSVSAVVRGEFGDALGAGAAVFYQVADHGAAQWL